MENCFRTALWVFVLLGCLQAAPTCAPEKADFHFKDLKNINCNGNVTFKCPKDVSGSGIIEIIIEGLEKANKSCPCERCADTLDAFDHLKVPSVASKSTACTRGTEGSLTFNDFVHEVEGIIENIYSNC